MAAGRPDAVVGRDIVFEDDHLRVSRQGDATGRNVILCFTGLRQRLGAIGGPEEFVGSTQLAGFDAVFVTDKTRSWFNAFPVERLLEVLSPIVEGRTIHALGNSMGAFGAIWISKYLPVKAVLAFAPQFRCIPTWCRTGEVFAGRGVAAWRDGKPYVVDAPI